MSNRLPTLAAEIRRAHADVQEAAKTAAERAIEAGHALIEAKALVKHGEWLPWLRDHCALADRTARLYMQIAKKGANSATVANLGLKAAAQAITFRYGDYFHQPLVDGDEADRLEWWLFLYLLRGQLGWRFEDAANHIDWLGRRDFMKVDEWLGPEGRKFVSTWGGTISDELIAAWRAFRAENAALSVADIQAILARLAEPEPPQKSRRRRKAGA